MPPSRSRTDEAAAGNAPAAAYSQVAARNGGPAAKDAEERRGLAAFLLGGNPTAVEALTRGVPVPRERLNAELLERIGEPAEGEPLTLTDDLALRVVLARTPEEAASAPRLSVVDLEAFISIHEPGAAALLGGAESALIAQGSDVMFYGDGGAGKTTLAIDLACHLAAGDEWLGISIERAARVLVIENEGPRPHFRAKLRRKAEGWRGSALGDRVQVLEEPWSELTLAAEAWRSALAAAIRKREIDVVVLGPVTRSGMNEAGTLQEVRDFSALLGEVRRWSGRPVVFVLVHHEAKSGKVSGAWEGSGDTLLHVQGQGHGRTRLYVQKARWSSAHHGTTMQLVWTDGEGFALAEGEPTRPERVWDDIATFVLEHGGCAWNEVDAAVSGQRDYLIRRREQMLADALLVNAGRGQRFALWHRDDPARPTLDATGSEARTGREPADSDPGGEVKSPGTGSTVPPYRGEPVPGEPPPAVPGEGDEPELLEPVLPA